jgi:hypothetical protein
MTNPRDPPANTGTDHSIVFSDELTQAIGFVAKRAMNA